ncbi:MAG: hypothetical protein NDI84_01650 [Steroidobacteraceae bacterium]|nr:hypothetical protein [Steroidobacteraceae bacterium]
MKFAARSSRTLGAAAAILFAFTTSLPAAHAAGNGQRVVYEGTIAVAVEDDFARGRATKRYFLDEQNLGSRVELQLSEHQGKALRTGQKIRVRGTAVGGGLSADAATDSVTVLAEPMAAAPITARKAVVILVDIKDSTGTVHAVSSTCDGSARSSNIMFGDQAGALNVDGCYQDASFGALGFGGASYPGSTLDVARVTINETATIGSVCNYSAWGAAADRAVTGVTLANYQHRVYVVPSNVGCSWAGLAYVGCGSSCQAWVKAYSGQACGYPDAYAHEIGHNLGMWHASTDTNNDGALDCEYCDTSSFMGYATGSLRTLNGPHKVQMGWASGARLVDGSQGGTFTVASLALAPAGSPQVVRVRPTSGDPYYIAFRTGVGYDSTMPSATTYLNKLNVHRYSGSGNSRFIASLGDGQTFNDASSGITIQQLSRTADSATFTVSTVCAPQAPTLAISPSSQGAGATLPATRSYTLTVTNRDSASCASSTFALSSTLPASLTGGLTGPGAITVAPGASGTATLSVTAPAGTATGSYTVSGGTVADAAHAAVTANATFWIDATAPNPPTNLRASAKGNKVALSWTAATDTGGSGIARYEVRRGAVVAGTSASTTYSDSPGNGTFTYTVVAIDGAGNTSGPSSSVTVKVGRSK